MKCSTVRLSAFASFCVVVLPICAAGIDYAGRFEDAELRVAIAADGASYKGEVRKGDQVYPLVAREDGDHLAGAYAYQGRAVTFTATRRGDELTVSSAGKTYVLRQGQNPLGAGANPAAADGKVPAATTGPAAADPLADYTIINKTDFGRSMAREVPGATTNLAALRATFPDLARYFGGRPKVLGAYQDQRDHKSAYVSFSTQVNGRALTGFVTTKLVEKGAVVFVVFGQADAPRAEWAKLLAKPEGNGSGGTTAAGGEGDLSSEMAKQQLKTYAFPDRTGAIGLAAGWTTSARTESNLVVAGPAGQQVRMAMGGQCYTPDSMMVRQNQQLAANGRRFGGNGAGQNLHVAPYSDDPASALVNFTRANSAFSQRAGGPGFAVDRILSVEPVPAGNQGAHAAQIIYDRSTQVQGGVKHERIMIQFEVGPLTGGSWTYYVSMQLIAPVETFKADLPVMLAQAFSLSENAAAVNAKSKGEIEAAQKLARAQQDAAAKIAQAHYQHNDDVREAGKRRDQGFKDAADDDTKRHRIATDVDETIRGIRTIEDTQTGEKQSVNLTGCARHRRADEHARPRSLQGSAAAG